MISGLQKMTLLDYPGKVACTVFLGGCNFRCPFCHNSGLLNEPEEFMTKEELLAFLNKRIGLLDGVCITGGEPTLQPYLRDLIADIKALGFLVKLDTNGSRPKVLKALLEESLLDYVAMDIKNAPHHYGQTVGAANLTLYNIEESMQLLMQGDVPYEFRTTVMDELHDEAAMTDIGNWFDRLRGDCPKPDYFIQPYVNRDSVLVAGLHTPSKEKLQNMADFIAPFVKTVKIRALD